MFNLAGTLLGHLEFIVVGGLVLLVFRLLGRWQVPYGLRLPPGPPKQPVVGNILHMPTEQQWVTLSKWAKEYGDLVYLNGLGKSILIINSPDIAHELFEKRSSIYSDRGKVPMINDLMGLDWLTTFLRYGEQWRKHRKIIHQKFNPGAVEEYLPIKLKHTRELIRQLYKIPDQFLEHLQQTSWKIIMEIVYGIEVLPKDDPYISVAEKAIAGFTLAAAPGAFLVDTLPILKHVPEWIPGAGFQKKARIWRQCTVVMNTVPFQAVKQAMKSGTAIPSFTSSLLEELSVKGNGDPEHEKVIRDVGSSLYGAGSDTTINTLHTFFLAMVLFPEAQRKAQEELDRVVGSNRLPEFEDREKLPYINALCKEVFRWHPITPLGAPHRVTQDDVFEGYFIPAGTIVLGNTWMFLHDKGTYGPDTDKFYPERFLTPGMKDPTPAFGYGRRICPGQYFASNSVYLAVASILSVFDISPLRDSTGKAIHSEAVFLSGILSHPAPFKCTISPRSEAAKRLILQGV